MLILNFKQFICEKLNIKPISKEKLQTNIDDEIVDEKDYTKRNMKPAVDAISKFSVFIDRPKVWKAIDDTNSRFDEWELTLPLDKRIDKHFQRAFKKMTREKVIATLWVAFHELSKNAAYKKVIEEYIKRVCREFNLTRDQVIDIFFEK